MRTFTYENQGTNTLLVYEIQPEDGIDSVGLGMITNNTISGLAPCVYTQVDERKFIKYNVSAKIPVSQFFSGQVNKKRLIGVFSGIVDAMLAADEYMIEPESVLLDLDYMFANVSTCETTLICLPIRDEMQQQIDAKEFFKQIMFSTQFDQTENCDHVAKIINYLNSATIFSFLEFKKVLQSISPDAHTDDKQGATTPIGNLNYFLKQPQTSNTPQQPVLSPMQTVAPVQNVANNVASGVGGSIPTPDRNKDKTLQSSFVPKAEKDQQKAKKTMLTAEPPFEVQIPGGIMEIPGAKPQGPMKNEPVVDFAEHGKSEEKEISLFYLLQHYNKENAAAYKAQKKAKKEQQSANSQMSQPVMPPMDQSPMPPMSQVSIPPMGQPIPHVASQPQGQAMAPENFGETIVLNESMDSGTTVLSQDMVTAPGQVVAMLKRVKTGEHITVNKQVFRIGKEKSFVDLYIGDNSAVSRSHASIMEKAGQYYVVDTNSTNHTFVNDKMIQSNVEVKISSGDQIRLANEEFVFMVE